MSARESRFEIVRTDAGFHARHVAANGRIVWATEVYKRREAAASAVYSIARALSPTARIWFSHDVMSRGNSRSELRFGHPDDDYGTAHRIEVRELDRRYVPPPVVLETPFYFSRARLGGGDFWHDREYHYRNCLGDECTEGTPPAGTEVRGRMGRAVAS